MHHEQPAWPPTPEQIESWLDDFGPVALRREVTRPEHDERAERGLSVTGGAVRASR
ncbi:MAG: hypothetical protein HZB16_21760 [Armatimonadetes bacterium]|nr:hypothetical protein [Armatimonadota bacterium]